MKINQIFKENLKVSTWNLSVLRQNGSFIFPSKGGVQKKKDHNKLDPIAYYFTHALHTKSMRICNKGCRLYVIQSE